MKSLMNQRGWRLWHPRSCSTGCIGLVVLLASVAFLSACSGDPASGESSQPRMREAVPVTVATVVQKNIPVQVRVIGTVEAYSTVSIKAQINGPVTKVYFKEGQDVKKGDLLFTIDPRPFEAALKQAEANLARDTAQVQQAEANLAKDMAQAKNAEVEAQRYAELIKKEVVSKEEYDQRRTNADAFQAAIRADQAAVDNAKAAVRADQAAVDNAKIQLGYCSIRSPIDGRTGSILVHEGNLVKANDTPALLVINQMTPIYVAFSVPEQQLSEIKKYTAAGKLDVEAIIPNDEKHPAQGVITFIDNAVDSATGTIRLKGTFANHERRLWPGQFVNVVLTLTTQPNAIVIPSQAVQTGQQGPFVFVVKPDLTVESRPIAVGRTVDGETVIEKGLPAGEKVVTDGQLRLVPGAKVEIKSGLESR